MRPVTTPHLVPPSAEVRGYMSEACLRLLREGRSADAFELFALLLAITPTAPAAREDRPRG